MVGLEQLLSEDEDECLLTSAGCSLMLISVNINSTCVEPIASSAVPAGAGGEDVSF